jgi:hypothetical protein
MTKSFIQTVETDAAAIWNFATKEVETGAVTLWNLAKPLFAAVEPTVIADLRAAIEKVLAAADTTQSLDALETAVLNALEAAGGQLFTIAKGLGSNLLQVLIGLVKAG